MLSLQDLTVGFNGVVLFDKLSHEFSASSITSIRKSQLLDGSSTLLKCCAGILAPNDGSVAFKGTNIEELTDQQRFQHLSYCFEAGGMVSLFTIYNNLAMPLVYHNLYPKREIEERILHTSEELQISHLLDKEPLQLTDVQLRLVNLARALIVDADAIFIDELQSGMSRQIHDCVVSILRKQADRGKVVVMVTTSGDDDSFADQYLSINQGRLRAVS